ncbi:MAG TPA: hypothetical protein VN451_01160 [Chitinophagaceae bacterium]|nr:hypothetical protein [Chitinophagaceae bacterium]
MSNNENNGLQLLIATTEHTDALLALQKAFHKYTPPEKSEYSFAYEVNNDPFSEEDFRNIVTRNECVIIIDGDMPVGYMLADTCSQTRGLTEFQQVIEQLIKENKLGEETKLMPRYLEVLNPQLYEEPFREMRWQMLAYLIYCNKTKYNGLCFTFFTNATTLMEKLSLGWKIAFDNGLYFFLVWEFSQLNNDQ